MGVHVTEHDDGTVTLAHGGASVRVPENTGAIADALVAFGQSADLATHGGIMRDPDVAGTPRPNADPLSLVGLWLMYLSVAP
jgi:hypothetical protein